MDKQEYFNEEEYQRNAKKLKNAGKIVLIIGAVIFVVGIILMVLGFLGFGNGFTEVASTDVIDEAKIVKTIFGGFGLIAIGGMLETFGIFVGVIGGILLFVGYRREIKKFTTQQVMPLAQEGIDKMTPTVANASEKIAKGISKGIQEGKNSASKE